MVTNKRLVQRENWEEVYDGLLTPFAKLWREVELMKPNICYRDEGGNCPYSNEVGTCFGFCMKEILKEQRERKQKHEQTEEDNEDYG